jgi:hypothetical protein
MPRTRKPNGPTERLERDIPVVLGIDGQAVAALPQITHILKDAGVDPWPYLAGSDDEVAVKLVAARNLLTQRMQTLCPIEALCLAAGVTTSKALGVIQSAVFEQSGKAGELMYAAHHVQVVTAAVGAALHPDGHADRKMLLQHQGFAPVPKTTIVKTFGDHTVVGQQVNQTAVLQPVEDRARRLQDRFNERVLPAAQVVEVEADYEPEPDD